MYLWCCAADDKWHTRTCVRLLMPSTKQIASKMLLFPLPLRPVMALNSGSKPDTTVRCAYDLKPSMITSCGRIGGQASQGSRLRK